MALGLVLSLLAGVVLAGLVFPFVGVAGLIGKSASDEFLALPADLETPPLAQRSAPTRYIASSNRHTHPRGDRAGTASACG